MKRIVILLFFATSGLLGFFLLNNYQAKIKIQKKFPEKKITATNNKTKKIDITSTSIFIPYWSLDEQIRELNEYDNLIYFGISTSKLGINKQESGYNGIEKFISLVPSGKKKLLTLRMIDDDVNMFVLENEDIQEKIIKESLEIIEENKFDGIVLDLEISDVLNKDTPIQIDNFVHKFYTATNENYRAFFLTIYGDSFFRGRPFDVPFLAKNSDGILIMAYDFHKSRGEPGPNFPFESGPSSAKATAGKLKYQYNFKKMISDFSKSVAKEKLTVVFGMFGYDWLVDEKKRPIRQAEALSLSEINNKFIAKCEFKNCVIKRDTVSKETEINYITSSPTPDEENIYRIDYHIVWFEDEESVEIKTEYLKERGIGNISFWAFGYF